MNQRLKFLLTLSVVLNVLLAGVILGSLSQQFIPLFLWHNDVEKLAAKLSADKHKLFEETMRPAWKDMDEAHAQIDTEKKHALHLLKAEPFNEAAYLTTVQHINDLHTRMKQRMAESIATLAKQFSAEERVILADVVALPPTPPPGAIPACLDAQPVSVHP